MSFCITSHVIDFEIDTIRFCCSDNGKKVSKDLLDYLHVMINIYGFITFTPSKYCFMYNHLVYIKKNLHYCVYTNDNGYYFEIYGHDNIMSRKNFSTIYKLYDYLNTNYSHLRKEPTHKLAIEQ